MQMIDIKYNKAVKLGHTSAVFLLCLNSTKETPVEDWFLGISNIVMSGVYGRRKMIGLDY